MQGKTKVPFDYKPRSTARKSKRRPRRLIAGITFAVSAALLFAFTRTSPESNELEISSETSEEIALPAIPVALPTLHTAIDVVVRRDDTLEKIFRKHQLALEDLTAILGLPGVRTRFSQIRPGDTVNVVHHDGMLMALKRRVSETEVLSITRGDNGFVANIIDTPIDIRTVHAHGTIDSSLFTAARAAGVSPEIILQLANDIFGWEIDFALDIRPGDRFRLVYEQRYREDEYVGDGKILAAEFVNDGEMHRAVHYASADGKIDGYFSPDGRSMRRQFLRAPLDFTRVSSNFNKARRHPILNILRAHKGVDYAAPTGTPVKAAGDGRIDFAGTNGGYGRVVTLEHGGRITTVYAHLSRFAAGVREGKRVKQGEIIGYVGTSGAATGPHLHYEYRVNGTHLNPRTVRLPAAIPIPAEYQAEFQTVTTTMLTELERPADSAVAALPTN